MSPAPVPVELLAVTGPRCNLVCGSRYQPYLAAPYGDGVAPGCWGLLHAYASFYPRIAPWIDEILARGTLPVDL